MKCLHVISGLSTGGAEMMLLKLLTATQWRDDSMVISLSGGGVIRDRITALGVPVVELGAIRGRIPSLSAIWRFGRLVRGFEPHLVQGWMYHGNIAAVVGTAMAARPYPVLWNIRSTLADLGEEKRMTATVIRAGAHLSRWPVRIIYPSETAAAQHETIGYRPDRRILIGNGFDVERFTPDNGTRATARSSLGIREGTLLIGHVARFHPMKDHLSLLRAISQLRAQGVDAHLLMIGTGADEQNPELRDWRSALALDAHVSLLGERSDLAGVTPGFDIAVSSSSWGEAFPNVLGEAMACGVPCVATDVGDSRRVVGEAGRIVPPRDPEALARALGELAHMPLQARRELGMKGRRRVVEHFSLPAIVAQYESLYADVDAAARRVA